MVKKYQLFFFVFFGTIFLLQSQTWTYYKTTNSGLPTNRVWALGIDAYGIKWCGTQAAPGKSGLASFNGTQWTTYDSTNSAMPINQTVWDIKFDKNGNRWFATGGGLVKYDGSQWKVYNTSNSGIISNYVKTITFDKSGNIWVGCRLSTGGISKFDGTVWTNYDSSNTAIPDNDIFSISFDTAGYLWIGAASGGIVKFNPATASMINTYNTSNSAIISNQCHTLLIDNKNVKWFGSSESFTGGISKFDDTTWTTYTTTLPTRSVRKIIQDTVTEQLWIAFGGSGFGGTGGGISKYDRNATWINYDATKGLPTNNIRSVAIDYVTGDVWVGTIDSGIAVLKTGNTGVKSIKKLKNFKFLSESDLLVFPNPVLSSATITYVLNEPANVDMCVFNVEGVKVDVPIAGKIYDKGTHNLIWEHNLQAGFYFIRLTVNGETVTKKIVIAE